jgi:hypothetical protein
VFISLAIWILLRRIHSNILDMMGKRLIGLYHVTLFGGLPSFSIMIIWADFHSIGK